MLMSISNITFTAHQRVNSKNTRAKIASAAFSVAMPDVKYVSKPQTKIHQKADQEANSNNP